MRTVVIMLLSVTCTTQAAAPPVPRVDLYGRSVKFAESFVHAWNVATGGNARDVVTLPMQATLLGYSANGDEGVFRRASKLIHWDFTKGKPLAEHSRPRDPILAVALVGKRLMTATCDGAMLTMRASVPMGRRWSQVTRMARCDCGIYPAASSGHNWSRSRGCPGISRSRRIPKR